MRVIDLTQKIYSGMKIFPGDVVGVTISRNANSGDNGYNGAQFDLLDFHTGTHLDAPRHFDDTGTDVSSIRMDSIIGSPKIVNALNKKRISLNDVKKSGIEKNIVLVYTGWGDRVTSENYFKNHPYLTITAANFLIEKGIKCIGIDFPSVDKYNSNDFIVHKMLSAKGIPIVENLTNLKTLVDIQGEVIFIALPLKIVNAEASPVRAIALVNESESL